MSLVLALDVSASVDFAEFALMAGGLAAALRDDGQPLGLVRGEDGGGGETLVHERELPREVELLVEAC